MPFFDGLNSVQSPGGHRTQRAWVGVGCMGNNREGKLRKTSKNSKKSKVLEGVVKRVSAQSKMRWKNPKIPKGNNTLQDALRPGGTTSKCISINMLQNAFKKGGFSRGFYTFLRMCRTVRRASFWRLQLCAVFGGHRTQGPWGWVGCGVVIIGWGHQEKHRKNSEKWGGFERLTEGMLIKSKTRWEIEMKNEFDRQSTVPNDMQECMKIDFVRGCIN